MDFKIISEQLLSQGKIRVGLHDVQVETESFSGYVVVEE